MVINNSFEKTLHGSIFDEIRTELVIMTVMEPGYFYSQEQLLCIYEKMESIETPSWIIDIGELSLDETLFPSLLRPAINKSPQRERKFFNNKVEKTFAPKNDLTTTYYMTKNTFYHIPKDVDFHKMNNAASSKPQKLKNGAAPGWYNEPVHEARENMDEEFIKKFCDHRIKGENNLENVSKSENVDLGLPSNSSPIKDSSLNSSPETRSGPGNSNDTPTSIKTNEDSQVNNSYSNPLDISQDSFIDADKKKKKTLLQKPIRKEQGNKKTNLNKKKKPLPKKIVVTSKASEPAVININNETYARALKNFASKDQETITVQNENFISIEQILEETKNNENEMKKKVFESKKQDFLKKNLEKIQIESVNSSEGFVRIDQEILRLSNEQNKSRKHSSESRSTKNQASRIVVQDNSQLKDKQNHFWDDVLSSNK